MHMRFELNFTNKSQTSTPLFHFYDDLPVVVV